MARFSLADAVAQTQTALQSVLPGVTITEATDNESYTVNVDGKPKTVRNGRVVMQSNDDHLIATAHNASAFWALKVLRDNSGLLLLVPSNRPVTLQNVTLERKPKTQTRAPKRKTQK